MKKAFGFNAQRGDNSGFQCDYQITKKGEHLQKHTVSIHYSISIDDILEKKLNFVYYPHDSDYILAIDK